MRIIAVKERSAGNESVGNEWVETKIFDESTPIGEVVKWQSKYRGRLMLTIADEQQDF